MCNTGPAIFCIPTSSSESLYMYLMNNDELEGVSVRACVRACVRVCVLVQGSTVVMSMAVFKVTPTIMASVLQNYITCRCPDRAHLFSVGMYEISEGFAIRNS